MWILIAILIILIILGVVVAIAARKGKKHKTDYYTFFIMGLIWTIFGVYETIRNRYSVFLTLGLVFLVTGLIHKKEWKQNHVPFNKLPKGQKRTTMMLTIILGFLVLAGLIVYLLFS